MPFHVSMALVSCADGSVGAPFVVHSTDGKSRGVAGSGKGKATASAAAAPQPLGTVTKKEWAGLLDKSVDPECEDDETLQIGIAVTDNGSMTKASMPEWIRHIDSKILQPRGQGSAGEPVLLFGDGHASRFSLVTLMLMLELNIFFVCLFSHTSIWQQPNDNNVNRVTDCEVGRATSKIGQVKVTSSRQECNKMFRVAWTAVRTRASTELAQSGTGSNFVTSAWNRVGLGGNNLNPCASRPSRSSHTSALHLRPLTPLALARARAGSAPPGRTRSPPSAATLCSRSRCAAAPTAARPPRAAGRPPSSG